jgi:hypothetical protein
MPRRNPRRRRLSLENARRVAEATWTLDFYRSLPGADPDEALTDLMCNLMHLCANDGTSFDAILKRARMHFDVEIREP